jgi:hypothetical protein
MAERVGTVTCYASFLLRLWRADQSEAAQPAPGWQGEAEHIQTRQRWTFDTMEDLLRLLQDQLEDVRPEQQDGIVTTPCAKSTAKPV